MNRLNLFSIFFLLTVALCTAQTPDCKLAPGWSQDGPLRTFECRQPVRVHGRQRRRLPDLQLRQDERRHLQVRRGDAGLRRFRDGRSGSRPTAFSCPTAIRACPVEKIGMAAQIQPRRGMFVKDKYFVEIAANPEGRPLGGPASFPDGHGEAHSGAVQPAAAADVVPAREAR